MKLTRLENGNVVLVTDHALLIVGSMLTHRMAQEGDFGRLILITQTHLSTGSVTANYKLEPISGGKFSTQERERELELVKQPSRSFVHQDHEVVEQYVGRVEGKTT